MHPIHFKPRLWTAGINKMSPSIKLIWTMDRMSGYTL